MLAWRKLFLQCGCPYLSVPQRIRTKGELYSADKISLSYLVHTNYEKVIHKITRF